MPITLTDEQAEGLRRALDEHDRAAERGSVTIVPARRVVDRLRLAIEPKVSAPSFIADRPEAAQSYHDTYQRHLAGEDLTTL